MEGARKVGKVRGDSAFEEFPNSADPVELPQAFLRFITMKGNGATKHLQPRRILKIIFLSFFALFDNNRKRHRARVLGYITYI